MAYFRTTMGEDMWAEFETSSSSEEEEDDEFSSGEDEDEDSSSDDDFLELPINDMTIRP